MHGAKGALLAALLAGCASRDWVVVQSDREGRPLRCWELRETKVTASDDGISWTDPTTGNIVSLTAPFSSVQVAEGRWDEAFAELGLSRESCAAVRQRRYDPVSGSFVDPRGP